MVSLNASRLLDGAGLATALRDARDRTWALVDDLSDSQWMPPYQTGVNPVAWELAHLAWFAEFWILRGPHRRNSDGFAAASRPPLFVGPDMHFDSAQLAHRERWTTPMPSRGQLKDMLARQLDACIHIIADARADALYFQRLALFHEDMHAEALIWTRAALGYPAPTGIAPPESFSLGGNPRQIHMESGPFDLGMSGPGFAFDNEQPARHIDIAAFEIDSAAVSAGEYLRFVEAGGYTQTAYWPADAGTWRQQTAATCPSHWRRDKAGNWQIRRFDQWLPVQPEAPVMHVNAFEAEAYCRWAGRRLPTAAEWEYAAVRASDQQAPFVWGHSVWEWTSTWFHAYPGFAAGPYAEYSQPWFGNHRELRGGAFATSTRMHHPRYRNFFLPHRSDIFTGFRTVSI